MIGIHLSPDGRRWREAAGCEKRLPRRRSLMLSPHVFAAVCCAALAVGAQPANATERPSTKAPDQALKTVGAQAKARVAGHTLLRHWGRFNEILYFAPNDVVHQWVSGRSAVVTSPWTVVSQNVRPNDEAKIVVCTHLPHGPPTGGSGPGDRKKLCFAPSVLFQFPPRTESRRGDVFKLVGRSEAPADLRVARTTIDEVMRTIAPTRHRAGSAGRT
jgi:hypothetical protein